MARYFVADVPEKVPFRADLLLIYATESHDDTGRPWSSLSMGFTATASEPGSACCLRNGCERPKTLTSDW